MEKSHNSIIPLFRDSIVEVKIQDLKISIFSPKWQDRYFYT